MGCRKHFRQERNGIIFFTSILEKHFEGDQFLKLSIISIFEILFILQVTTMHERTTFAI